MIVCFLQKDVARSTQEHLVLRGEREPTSCHGLSGRIIDVVYMYIYELSNRPAYLLGKDILLLSEQDFGVWGREDRPVGITSPNHMLDMRDNEDRFQLPGRFWE